MTTSAGTPGVAAAVVALATAITLGACGTQVAGTGAPSVLHIGTPYTVGAPAVAGSGRDPYPLAGTLPVGPSAAPVERYAPHGSTASDVTRLAAALGVTGAALRHPFGWEVVGPTGILRVRQDGTAWSYSRGTSQCPSYSVDIDHAAGATAASGCAVAVPVAGTASGPVATGTTSDGVAPTAGVACPAPTPPATVPATCPTTSTPDPAPRAAPESDAATLAAAAPVLAAVGLAADPARVLPGAPDYPLRTVAVDPVVDGAATSGVRTVIDVGHGGVVGATGVLATPSRGADYPIVSAAAALDRLRAMPQPEIAIACVQGKVCPGIGPRVVTGAHLGLMGASDAGAPVLVPAWLFTIKGTDDPVAVVAVDPSYLADPAPGRPDGASSPPNPATSATAPAATSAPDPGASSGGRGATPGPGPADLPASDVLVSAPVTSLTASVDGRTLVLHLTGLYCEAYAGEATESASAVDVRVIAARSPGVTMACPARSRPVDVTVTLPTPLGDRTVLDASTGRVVARR